MKVSLTVEVILFLRCHYIIKASLLGKDLYMQKVLVVDDTKNIRLLLTTCLELNGYDVVQAKDGNEALKIFETDSFSLVFLDIKLPEVSGTEVLRRIRKNGNNTPVIIMTAFATVRNAVECTKLGAVAYLQKPFTADKVKHVLHEMINENTPTSKTNNTIPNTESKTLEDYIKKSSQLISIGKYNEAYDILKKTLSLDPLHKKTYELISEVCNKKKKYEEADKFLKISKQL